jgi:hypothetical protein
MPRGGIVGAPLTLHGAPNGRRPADQTPRPVPTPPGFAYDVFLSYHSGDRPRVQRLAERLRKAGARAWFDRWSIALGDDIYLAIERGLQRART